jgi:aspartate ammonia-lyase
MKMSRIEKDSLGEKQIPSDALYGIHALRAKENFPGNTPFPLEWYRAVGIVKLACYNTYMRFSEAASEKYGDKLPFNIISSKILNALCESAREIGEGNYFEHFIVPAVQGGAGTSINMNINEIIANSSLIKTGKKAGDYNAIDPIEHANIYQSTNDVIPSALTVATLKLLQSLEDNINAFRQKVEECEKNNRNKLRPGYTQMQEAVPSTIGMLFSNYNEALSRDWWRVSKCSERLKTVNLGGGAIGTGLAVPRYFIMEVIPELRKITGLPVTHSDNLSDTTSNLDRWVEVHSILKAHAVTLEKISADVRLLASDFSKDKIITLPDKQVGSSIMPGKINPVIPEFVISCAHKIYSNDVLVSSLSGQGCLELNAYIPVIGTAIIESINLLISADHTLLTNLFEELVINEESGYNALMNSPSVTTALSPYIGYHKSAELAAMMKERKINIFEANRIVKVIDENRLSELLKPSNLMKLGFSLEDFIK